MRVCSRRRIPFGCSAVLILLSALAPARAEPQQVNEALVGDLARLLAAADARRFEAPLFHEMLRHPAPAVRRQAALAAGRIGDPGAVELVAAALEDSSQAVQAAAAFALGLLKDARALPSLVGAIRARPAERVAVEAVTALAKIGEEEGARALRDVLETASPTDARVAPAVGQALLESWRLGSRAPVAALLAFAEAADAGVRWRAVYALARLRAPAGAGALLTALGDPEPRIRAAAARGLSRALVDSARLEPSAVLARLSVLLRDPEAPVRINALRALVSYADSGAATSVTPLLTDPDPGVVVQAETTLGVLRGAAAVTALQGRLTSAVFAVKRQAVIGVAQAAGAAGLAPADTLAGDPDWRWRRVAAEAFGASAAGSAARSRLEALLADPDGRVVAQALQAFGRIVPDSDAALVPRARALLAHEDPAVRSVAADLLGRHPDPEGVDPLVQAYLRAARDPFHDARLSAVAALARIAGASAAGRAQVASRFLGAVPRSADYLVRRLAAERLPDAAGPWGPVGPIVTGRGALEYRDIARRLLVPALAGQPAPRITIETDRGRLVLELLPTEAPLTVAAFLALVERRFFDGSRWHRVVPNFVVQDGDPRGDGNGGPGFVLRDEVNPTRYETGTMGMALSGPDTGGSQFFITHAPQPHLDGIYTVFGRVVQGAPVLAAITQGERIRSIHR